MQIRRLEIRRFRGIERLTWEPHAGINCLIGPGDAGKSTVLSAIGLLLNPSPPSAASEFDYWQRNISEEFEISAVLAGVEDQVSAMRIPPLRGWIDSALVDLPDEGDAEPVELARVSASRDLEVSHWLIPPSGEPLRFPVSLRQRFALAEVGGDSGRSSEFRLSRRSLMEKHLGSEEMRGQVASLIAQASAEIALTTDVAAKLEVLSQEFRAYGLPSELALGILGPPGWSLLTSLGLMSGSEPSEAIPLARAGRGTRKLALFRLAIVLAAVAPVLLLDEPEVGLEPYRQRSLLAEVRSLVAHGGQAFMATHSPAILKGLDAGELWHLRPGEDPRPLGDQTVRSIVQRAPDALLSTLVVLCEGDTEAAMLPVLWASLRPEGTPSYDALGITFVASQGQPSIFREAKALLEAGLPCGMFVDAEVEHAGRRARFEERPNCVFGVWTAATHTEGMLASDLPWEHLDGLLETAATVRGRRPQSLLQQVAASLDRDGQRSLDELRDATDEQQVRMALGQTMHTKGWFKSLDRGRALGKYLAEVGVPDATAGVLREFFARLARALE